MGFADELEADQSVTTKNFLEGWLEENLSPEDQKEFWSAVGNPKISPARIHRALKNNHGYPSADDAIRARCHKARAGQ